MIPLLVLNVIFSVVYLVIRRYKYKQEILCRCIIMLLFPVFGALCFIITDALERLRNEQEQIDYSGLVTKLQSFQSITEVDFDREINIIPIEQALMVNENKTKRKTLIDMLKRNIEEYIDFLKIGLNDDDTETSHYAVSAIVEIRRKFDLSLQELSVRYEKEKSDYKTASSYAEVLKKYIESGLLDQRNQRKYEYIYLNVLENILSGSYGNLVEEKYYEEIANNLLRLREYEKAELYCKKYVQSFSRSENPYLLYMKLYYELRQYDNLQTILGQLRAMPVILSNRGINMVRFWSGGAFLNDKG